MYRCINISTYKFKVPHNDVSKFKKKTIDIVIYRINE